MAFPDDLSEDATSRLVEAGEEGVDAKLDSKEAISTAVDQARTEFKEKINVAWRAMLLQPVLKKLVVARTRNRLIAEDLTQTRSSSARNLEERIVGLELIYKELKETLRFMLGARWDLETNLVGEPTYSQFERERARLSRVSLLELNDAMTADRHVIHDVNNMFAAIFSLLELAKRHIANGNFDKAVELLSQRSEPPFEKVIEMIRVRVNREPLKMQKLEDLSKEAQSIKEKLPPDSDVVLIVEDELPLDITGELAIAQAHLSQLLFNLAHNAHGALVRDVPGEKVRKITISLRLDGDKVVVGVKDNGPGFKGVLPLQASHESNVRNAGGDGTRGNGLVFCFDLCEKAGGQLTLRSTHRDEAQDVGAEFEASFPLKTPADPR